jgi:hypothetical protein
VGDARVGEGRHGNDGHMSETQGYDAREGSGDIETDPAAMGEVSAAQPDGDGGAVPDPGALTDASPAGAGAADGGALSDHGADVGGGAPPSRT